MFASRGVSKVPFVTSVHAEPKCATQRRRCFLPDTRHRGALASTTGLVRERRRLRHLIGLQSDAESTRGLFSFIPS